MSFRFILFIGAVSSLAMSTPLFASDQEKVGQTAVMQSAPSGLYSPSDVANPPAEYPSAEELDPTGTLDARAKAAWLNECRRRANLLQPGQSAFGPGQSDQRPRGYDYCEAYLEDYYRNYSQNGAAYSYGNLGSAALPQPMQIARATSNPQVEEPYEEIITEEYVPVRSRSIARRTVTRVVRDKRIRIR